MSDTKRKVEIFSGGCPTCDEVIERVRSAACPSCDVEVLDMNAAEVRERAAAIGVKAVPAVAVDGVFVDCCTGRWVDLDVLRAAGLGRPIA